MQGCDTSDSQARHLVPKLSLGRLDLCNSFLSVSLCPGWLPSGPSYTEPLSSMWNSDLCLALPAGWSSQSPGAAPAMRCGPAQLHAQLCRARASPLLTCTPPHPSLPAGHPSPALATQLRCHLPSGSLLRPTLCSHNTPSLFSSLHLRQGVQCLSPCRRAPRPGTGSRGSSSPQTLITTC